MWWQDSCRPPDFGSWSKIAGGRVVFTLPPIPHQAAAAAAMPPGAAAHFALARHAAVHVTASAAKSIRQKDQPAE